MPNWHKICAEIASTPRHYEVVRRHYLAAFSTLTKRNAILYYSGWMQKPGISDDAAINDSDRNGFMSLLAGWNEKQRKKGLDLILHTPGGGVAATDALGKYLRAMFDGDIRVFVPQMAMSGGTMLACAGKAVVMGKHSSLGPIDPQIGGLSAFGVLSDLYRARKDIKDDNANALVWQPIIAKYPPGLVSRCVNAIEWANDIARDWLSNGMLKDNAKRVNRVISNLSVKMDGEEIEHFAKAHERQFSPEQCRKIGLKVHAIERNQEIQDAVLSVHHACMWALAQTKAIKIIENHEGSDFIRTVTER